LAAKIVKGGNEMQIGKEIIVVAPDQYKGLARKLTHKISKVPGFNGAFWTIKQYEDNEFQLGGNRYAILIGNSDENPVTKDLLLSIKTLNNQAGACFGSDGTKAVVFGEGKLEQEVKFKEVLKRTVATAAGADAFSTVGGTIAGGEEPLSVRDIWWIIPSLPIFLPWALVATRRKVRERELRTEQTKVALTLFLLEHFDAWAGLKE
jgi:hypothetical protein